MDYRRKKQTIITSILGLILVLIFSGLYYKWFYQSPTCFDKKQNQKEEGMDCGGPCAMSCELYTIKELQVESTKAVFLKNKLYDLIAKVNNINPNYGLGRFEYTFKLYDVNNQLLAEKKGSSFILPNQKKYLIETNVSCDSLPIRTDLIIEPVDKIEWQRLANDFQIPDIFVQDKQFKYIESKANESQASGIMKNSSVFDFDKIVISVALFNENKEIIGVNKTEINTVPAGQERYFSVIWNTPFSGVVKSVDIQADTNLFSDDNYMRRYGTVEKFQEYR